MIVLVTGHLNGSVREHMRRALGADSVVLGHDLRGLPALGPGDIVVWDTRFVKHNHEQQLRARLNGATFVRCQAGVGGLRALVLPKQPMSTVGPKRGRAA